MLLKRFYKIETDPELPVIHDDYYPQYTVTTPSDSCLLHKGRQTFLATVEPRFNEVLRDWGNLFVKSGVCYIEHLHLKKFRENY